MTATFTRAELDAHLARLSPEARARVRQVSSAETPKPAAPEVPGLQWIQRAKGWKEKDEQRECWRLLLGLGFQAKWLSQAQRSQQSKGIPDILARHQRRQLLLWVEVKRPENPSPWTPEQRAFADERLQCEHYVVGTEANLRAWLLQQGFELPPATYLPFDAVSRI